MLKLQIPKNRINELIGHLRDNFDPARLERGWAHYHKGQVAELELKHGVEVHALVRGTKRYEVILDLDQFGKSECSCPDGDNCKHMAAVAFALYAPFGRPELLLQHLKQAIAVRSRQQAKQTAVSKAAEKRQDRFEPPAPDHMPAQWQKFFDQQFYGFSLNQQQSIELFYSAVKEKLLPYGEDWEQPLRGLYSLHVLFFVMRKIEQFYQETKTSYLSYYIETGCRTVGRQCLEELLRLVPRLDVALLAEKASAPWKETLGLLAEAALSGKESPLSWSTVYRSVWWRMTSYPAWMAEERARLRLMLESPDLMPRRRDALLLAEAHFDVIEGDDDAARQKLEALSKREARDYFLYLHRCYEEEAWGRMLAWLRWLLPVVQRAQQEELRQFCQYWMEAVQRQTDDGEWVSVMIALLPRTYHFYTAYLMKAERYKAWIDLQLSNRVSPLDLYSLDLQTVEKHDPSLMLPLFHQAVERCIAEKNRTAYKNAMRLLKKLHALYKKLNRSNDWEDFIYRLAMKYSRLRALQEELRKGKWIP
ncbi:SWIM zinc finger family protein [Paenibacillus elgii]|uniref:SWIM zinc finger family protein n=1 Tax=Paenibacillus elgii TaxID=189691 RepID=UPI0020419F65|nr:SWIM zinc finger family protein [Paenibacillus elgii]MCM3270470.1 SWIM zinc finger family protein [Paenibacillus elgii]